MYTYYSLSEFVYTVHAERPPAAPNTHNTKLLHMHTRACARPSRNRWMSIIANALWYARHIWRVRARARSPNGGEPPDATTNPDIFIFCPVCNVQARRPSRVRPHVRPSKVRPPTNTSYNHHQRSRHGRGRGALVFAEPAERASLREKGFVPVRRMRRSCSTHKH